MTHFRLVLAAAAALALGLRPAAALDRPDITFKVFQFPANQIPRIDGDPSDWDIVPDSYAIDGSQMREDGGQHQAPDPKNFDLKVKVGWVKGLNQLFFLYQATKGRWDFTSPTLDGDKFELVVDGDASGGTLISPPRGEPGSSTPPRDPRLDPNVAHWAIAGVQAQNYHIFTPARGQGLVHVLGRADLGQGAALRQRRHPLQLQAGGGRQAWCWSSGSRRSTTPGPRARSGRSRRSSPRTRSSACPSRSSTTGTGRATATISGISRATTRCSATPRYLCAFRLMPLEPQFRAGHPGAVELERGGHGPPSGGVQGPVRRPGHLLEVGLRRRHDLDRADSQSINTSAPATST